MEKRRNSKKKKNYAKSSVGIVLGLLLVIVVGVVVANVILKANGGKSLFASIIKCNVANCSECVSNNPNYCSVCKGGYYLDNNGKCVKACNVANCSKCVSNNPNYCSKCNAGYSLNSNGKCVKANSCNVANCSKCVSNNPNYCSVCKNGYYLDNGKCVKTEIKKCWCVNSQATSYSSCVTPRGEMTKQECTKGCSGETPVWGDTKPECPYTFHYGTCTCDNGKYNGVCFYKYSSLKSCNRSCSGDCNNALIMNLLYDYGLSGGYYCLSDKKEFKNEATTRCDDKYGKGYVGKVTKVTTDFACGTYSSCTKLCQAKGFSNGSGRCY